eukprot:GHRQ01018837.1.p4 GENE.GHRQ01018837.1~~GHRQ01018837.1.p4  ORF type:complete len:107 (+),score=52.00 GHRQ01018837.1:397-717(+)
MLAAPRQPSGGATCAVNGIKCSSPCFWLHLMCAGGGSAAACVVVLLQFFEKVKARLRNRELYQDFLKCLNLYAQEIISRQELLNLAHVSSNDVKQQQQTAAAAHRK